MNRIVRIASVLAATAFAGACGAMNPNGASPVLLTGQAVTAGTSVEATAKPAPAPIRGNTLTVMVNAPSGKRATVSSNPAGLRCSAGQTCSAIFSPGTLVSLSGTGTAQLSGWAGVCSGTAPCAFVISGDSFVQANFY